MHPAYIQAELKKAGYSQKRVADEYGCTDMFVHLVIHKGYGSERLINFICDKIGKKPEAVFPKWFYRKNRRIKKAA